MALLVPTVLPLHGHTHTLKPQQTYKLYNKCMYVHTHKYIHKHRQTDGWTKRQADGQTDRQTDR